MRSLPLRVLLATTALIVAWTSPGRAQERDEPMPHPDKAAPVNPYPEADEPMPVDPYGEPGRGAQVVDYGAVDASTVRVFAIGSVGITQVVAKERHVTVAKPESGHGTGFSAGHGLIVTARHVVENAQHIVVRLPGEGGFYAARIIYEDKDNDVAVLHTEATVTQLELSSARLRVRQTVFAIGYPLDPSRTQAQSARGIIAGQKEDTIQLDMALNPGNSGGPLVDEQDHVVGMVVARGNPEKGVQGVGFAVRTDRLASAIREAERRLEAKEIAELTKRQKQSAVVVDELVQRGVFHEIRGTADVQAKLDSADVQKALDSLIARIEDPDLLVFVGGQLWNVYLALWAADDTDLAEVGLSRKKATELAYRIGYTSGVACRRAQELDAKVADRSPIVPIVLATWGKATAPAAPAKGAPAKAAPAAPAKAAPAAPAKAAPAKPAK